MRWLAAFGVLAAFLWLYDDEVTKVTSLTKQLSAADARADRIQGQMTAMAAYIRSQNFVTADTYTAADRSADAAERAADAQERQAAAAENQALTANFNSSRH